MVKVKNNHNNYISDDAEFDVAAAMCALGSSLLADHEIKGIVYTTQINLPHMIFF